MSFSGLPGPYFLLIAFNDTIPCHPGKGLLF